MADHRDPKVKRQRWIGRYVSPWVTIPILVLLLPLIIAIGIVRLSRSAALCAAAWFGHKQFVVFVYSDSPKWKAHIESRLLPKLPPEAVVINRSRPWDSASLAGRIYRHFGGHYEYCPIGIVIQRWRPARVFRLFRPFQAARSGDSSAIDTVQSALLAAAQVDC